MFEKALLRNTQSYRGGLDVGILAETLLFYQDISLVLDRGTAVNLITKIGFDNFSRLVKEGYVKPYFFASNFGAHTQRRGIQIHTPVEFSLVKPGNTPRDNKYSTEELLDLTFRLKGYEAEVARSMGKKLSKLMTEETLRWGKKRQNVCEMVSSDLEDQSYTNGAARVLMQHRFPGFKVPDDWKFVLHKEPDGYFAETNFHFAEVKAMYAQVDTFPEADFNSATIMAEILETRAEVVFASRHNAELVAGPLRSEIVKMRFDIYSHQREHNEHEIDLFQERRLDGRNVREVINRDERTFTEFLDLLDQSRRFKEWLKAAPADADLLDEYYKAVTADQWFQRMPCRLLRFVGTTGIGIAVDAMSGGLPIGTLAGALIGAGDTFILDRLLAGWRPNQFVDSQLKEFVGMAKE